MEFRKMLMITLYAEQKKRHRFIDSILKSRDITLPTKVCLFSQSYDFPVVMYGCESWTIKKAECQKILAFEL